MLLALLLSATAAEPAPLPALAYNSELEVEMPAVHIRASPLALTPWRTLADGMAAELALSAHGIRVEDASVVRIEDSHGRTRVSWTELSTGQMRLRTDKAHGPTVCSATVRGGIWSGSGSVAVYAPTPGREEAVGDDLGFLLIEDHPKIGALVALSPGDSVTVVNVRKAGVMLREWVEVARAAGSVSVDRKPSGERICYHDAG